MCPIPDGFSDRAMDVIARMKESQDALRLAKHAMSSHELQSALKLAVEFSKMYCTW
jgi:hypothetical protein